MVHETAQSVYIATLSRFVLVLLVRIVYNLSSDHSQQ
jgi:hypothetical protein